MLTSLSKIVHASMGVIIGEVRILEPWTNMQFLQWLDETGSPGLHCKFIISIKKEESWFGPYVDVD